MEITGITLICYLGGMGVKLSPLDNKWIPLFCGILGGALGALAMGIASGLAATGADQAVRQLGG